MNIFLIIVGVFAAIVAFMYINHKRNVDA